VHEALKTHPTLAFVQDADRLDALVPMGTARAAVFGGIHKQREKNTILTLVDLMDDRFVNYPKMMKTETGRKEAKKAWAYMLEFRKGKLEHADCEVLLQSAQAPT
jgi:uncharacterized protein